MEAIAIRLEALALRFEPRLYAIPFRLEAITIRVEAIAIRVEAIALIFYTFGSKLLRRGPRFWLHLLVAVFQTNWKGLVAKKGSGLLHGRLD